MKIFIVEDDIFFGQLLRHHMEANPDYEIHLFHNAKQCLSHLYLAPEVICLDFELPDLPGNILLKKIKETHPHVPIIIISGQDDIEVAIDFLKCGAQDYIVKNNHTKELLWNSILKVSENLVLKKEVQELKGELEKKYTFQNTIIGQSEAIQNVYKKLYKAASSTINVSITGETGTGKEVVAKAIHYNSTRKNKPFVAINMAAIPKELMESEFFGHEKGAFTGAVNRALGKFEQTNGGTLFLDEIAEMDINLQSKLLRAIQEREIIRVGGTERIKFDVRLITATHKNLALEVQQGNFRTDLYYRIIGLPVHLPPLRERGQDFLILSKYFMEQYRKENKSSTLSLSAGAIKKLSQYPFPGNIRELKSVIELACVMADQNEIRPEDLHFNAIEKDKIYFPDQGKTLKQYTQEIILQCLEKNNNDVLLTARNLDIGESTIYNMLRNLETHK